MTEQIGLRALERDDLSFIHTLKNNPAIMPLWFEEPYQTLAKLEDEFDKNIANPHQRQFILQKNDEKLGLVELVSISSIHRKAEFTIMIDPMHQGNGYAYPATRLAMDYAFSNLNLHKLYLIADKKNKKAIHVYKKAGFYHTADLPHEYFVNGSYHDAIIMSILEDEYWKMNK
ncbi:GNAT family N-acetyltransferase [Oceanobacillus halotolerans]|uniref:GNAT family N-acetyltransferase n=1 Tax=Oceanobacillus halotolerans TaxID=2663380 RepID=UPI0013DAEE38|nr:GNAT family N-acetyltransferase [Oceanobacillus halotolerans]